MMRNYIVILMISNALFAMERENPLLNFKILADISARHELIAADNIAQEKPKSDILNEYSDAFDDEVANQQQENKKKSLVEALKQDNDVTGKLLAPSENNFNGQTVLADKYNKNENTNHVQLPNQKQHISESLGLALCITAFNAMTVSYKELVGHGDDITLITVDGNEIISASKDKTLKIWDKQSCKCVQTLIGHTDLITKIIIDKDVIVSVSADNTIRIWNRNDYSCCVLTGHTDQITDVVINGDQIISVSCDNTMRVWDKKNGACLLIRQGLKSSITQIIVDGDKLIAGTKNGNLLIFDKSTNKYLLSCLGNFGSSVTVIRVDGTRVMAGSENGKIQFWNKNTGKYLGRLAGHQSRIRKLKVDNNRIIAEFENGQLIIWDMKTGKYMNTPATLAGVDEDRIISVSKKDTIRIWDINARIALLEKSIDQPTADLIIDGDKIIAVPVKDKTIRIYDLSSCKQFEDFICSLPLTTATFLNGEYVFLTTENKKILQQFLAAIEQRWGKHVMESVRLKLSEHQGQNRWCSVM